MLLISGINFTIDSFYFSFLGTLAEDVKGGSQSM